MMLRSLFALITMLLTTSYYGYTPVNLTLGLGVGIAVILLALLVESLIHEHSLPKIAFGAVGFAVSYFVAQSLIICFSPFFESFAKLPIFLFTSYLGVSTGLRISEEFSVTFSLTRKAPKMQLPAGEKIKIKIQRYGKEPLQGIGYLDDGTMVVVNGGGKVLGETIDATVLSVKQTTAGRIIFCNAQEDEEYTYVHG